MRWKNKPKPNWGDTKIAKKFALFPKFIEKENVWIWLEFYEVKVIYKGNHSWVDLSHNRNTINRNK